jgi:E3 ubiquitin-protein ligase HUWE1
MSRTSGKSKHSIEGKTESVESLASEGEEEGVEATGREETPDLYRNSALGMYGGVSLFLLCGLMLFFFTNISQEMEDIHFTAEDEMDEDEEDEDEDVEMDFGEETGSEDTSNSDDEGDDDDLENETRESGEVWGEGDEDEENEDLVENEDEDDDGDGDQGEEGEGDEEGDEEMMWQVSIPISFTFYRY